MGVNHFPSQYMNGCAMASSCAILTTSKDTPQHGRSFGFAVAAS
jgi:hypothetical protein